MDFSALTLVFMTALFDMVPEFWPTKPPVPLWLELIFEFITLQFSMLPRFLLASMPGYSVLFALTLAFSMVRFLTLALVSMLLNIPPSLRLAFLIV